MRKPGSKYYGIFMAIGLCIGTVLGVFMKDIGLWTSMGLLAGVVVDTLVNTDKNKNNE